MSRILRYLSTLAVLGLLSWGVYAADVPKAVEKPGGSEQPAKAKGSDLADFKTVDNCTTTRIARTISATAATPRQPGYLGIQLDKDKIGRLTVRHVDPDSPAAKVGLQLGDVVREVAGQSVIDAAALRELLRDKLADDTCKVAILRNDKPMNLEVKLAAISRPLTPQPGGQGGRGGRVMLGVQFGEPDKDGLPVEEVVAGGAAERAGLKAGDLLLKVDKTAVTDREKVAEVLNGKNSGDSVTLLIKRDGKEKELKATLSGGRGGRGGRGGEREPASWDNRRRAFTRDTYRLAVIPVEFPDQKHNDKATPADWENALFSKSTYTDKSATGQKVHGSLNDYYWEQSSHHLKVTGKVFNWVQVKNKRDTYGATSSGRADRTALLTEAVDKLLARDGKNALKDFDGIFFMYAGARPRSVQRGGLFWPHKSQFNHDSKRWDYFISNEGGERMSDISVICHEFGHMLGLPDLYARPETPGMEGVGVWCAMSNQLSGGKPQHFSAWSKEQLGWVKPAVIDPTVRQKLVLSPIFGSKKECFKVLLHPDGSEYLLLENRTKKGFDSGLPGEGLLIWRVSGNRVLVEESHGISGPSGPRSYPNAVPFPSKSNNAFTPYTTPSSKSLQGGGLPVHITNITRLPDGRITFFVGYEYF